MAQIFEFALLVIFAGNVPKYLQCWSEVYVGNLVPYVSFLSVQTYGIKCTCMVSLCMHGTLHVECHRQVLTMDLQNTICIVICVFVL